MTNPEFSDQFDILFNGINSNMAPGLDTYEKSVFLTKAQEEIVKAYFSPYSNKMGQGLGNSPMRDTDFSMLISVQEYEGTSISSEPGKLCEPMIDYRTNSKSVLFPDGVLAVLNETCEVNRGTGQYTGSGLIQTEVTNKAYLQVMPLQYSEYSRLMGKAFKRPLKHQAWRIMSRKDAGNSTKFASNDIIVGPSDTISKYTVRYVKRPNPIILEDLEQGLSINGDDKYSECELDAELHQDILQRAVELAEMAYRVAPQDKTTISSMSQTEKGFMARQ